MTLILLWNYSCLYWSSHTVVFCKKGVIKNFAKCTGKFLRQSLFLNRVEVQSPESLFKTRFWHRWFFVNFAIFLRTSFFFRTTQLRLLIFVTILKGSIRYIFKKHYAFCTIYFCSRINMNTRGLKMKEWNLSGQP